MPHPTAQARHRVIHLSTAGRLPRLLAVVVSAALFAAGLVVGVGAISATALSDIQLSATTDTSILAGEGAKVTFTATNPATDASGNLYNLSYQYVLPTGVSYQGGSTSPDTVGEPSVVTIVDTPANPPTVPTAITHQVLNWTNASDLAFGETATFTFNVQVDATVYPVGAAVQATDASAYANASPRILPKFDATTGAPIGGSYTAFGDVTPPPSTQVAAIKLTKTEGSPETELMRGVHDQTTVYKLAVTETGEGATDGVTVVDDIPAQLEYLGCGQVDNSVLRTAEYPGAPSLTQTPAIPGADCIQPQSVVTKLVSGKVVTEVTWSLGILAANQVVNIWYAAGIPLKENTTTWDGPGGTPALTGAQTANLDNNNGPSTRQSGKAATMTNTAVASGAYQGQLASSAPSSTVTSTATYTNKISDLSVVKTTSNSGFDAGAVANYSLNIRASEYESDSQMTIVDTIPNGLCPLVPDLSAVLTVDSGAQNPPAECQATGSISNATVTGVEAKADGSFLLTMVPDPTTTIAANGNLVIGYSALMRAIYTNVGAAPTAAGDSFTNSVDVNGTSTSVQDATTLAVEDGSKATLGSTPPTIQKLILPRPTTGTAVDCAAHDADYIDNHDYPKTGTTLPVYNLGDKICFKLIVDFSTSTRTRNAQIQDFVPTGTTYNGYSVSSSSTLGASEVVPETGGDPDSPVFDLGATVAGDTSGDLFVEKGVVLTMYVSAIVTSTAPDTSVDITANLMKYRQEATAGTVTALRYQANYGVAPAETVSLTKQTIARTPNTTISDPKDTLVQEGDSVTFGLTITNTGTSAIGNDFDVDNPTVWDALPAGITCADFVSASDGGVCTDPGDVNHPLLADTTVSTIVWSAVPTTIAAGSTYQLTYVLHIATGTSISQHFTNTASVVAFQAPNTNGGQTDFYPLGSLNPAHDSDGNTTQANDTSKFHTADAVVSKTATPNLPGTNKSASQVVAGETVDYTYSVVIPANSTVFNATLSDTLPTGLTLTANSTDQATINGTAYPVGATLPSGFTLTSSGTLTFPTTWDNTSSSPVTVSVILHGGARRSRTQLGVAPEHGHFREHLRGVPLERRRHDGAGHGRCLRDGTRTDAHQDREPDHAGRVR